jgi:hypothetical protein
LVRHLKGCLSFIGSKKQKALSVDASDNVTNFHFDETMVRELMSHVIFYHEYPFIMMEHVLFNKVLKVCTPHWRKISHNTAKALCFATYEKEKKKMKSLLSKVNKVNITTDM